MRIVIFAVLMLALWLFLLWRNIDENENDLHKFLGTVAVLLSFAVMTFLWLMLKS